MKPIIAGCAIVVLAFCPLAAGADLIDRISKDVARYPELSPVAIEILDKISKGASPDEQTPLAQQWDAAFKEAFDARARADRERQAAEEKRTPAMRRAAVLAACIKLRQRKVQTSFSPSDDGTSLQFLAPGHGAYRSSQFEYKAVPDDPLSGKWTVSYPKLEVVQTGSPEGPGHSFVEQKTSTCTVTENQLIRYLAKEPGADAPWAGN